MRIAAPEEAVLGRFPRFALALALCLSAALVCAAPAQQTPGSKAVLDTSEVLFSTMAAINACGYDQELASSAPLRAKVRAEVIQAVSASAEAGEARRQLCTFYRDHQQPDATRDLAQYVSLALSLDSDFVLSVKEADLPPDAAYVLGFLNPLMKFYRAAKLHAIWERHRPEYEALVERFHPQVANLIMSTDLYLRMPISGYVGRRFVILLEPMAAPGQANARNYGPDHFVVLTPSGNELKLEQVRHTYLHFVIDPLILKRANALKRLEPVLVALERAPIEEQYKRDPALLVTESLVRAVEARTENPKATEAAKAEAAQTAAQEGFVLAHYFNQALGKFERDEPGFKDALGDILYYINVDSEKKRALETRFVPRAAPEVLAASKPRQATLLDLAEERLAGGDAASAHRLAQQALDQKREEPSRALFLLARAATLEGDMQGALRYFERTLEVAQDARTLAWSHIYLGRIYDLKEERESALMHYRAALSAGDSRPETRAAAERGLQRPYEPPGERR